MTSSPAFALALGFVAACGGSVAAPSVAGVDATTVYWTNQYAGTVVRMTPK